MVTYRGYKTHVLYADETAYGTGGVPNTTIKGRIQNFTINKVNNLIRVVGLGEGRNETFVAWGNFEGTWSMEYYPADFEFLKYSIGQKSGTGNAVAPFYLEEQDLVNYTNGLMSCTLEVGSEEGTTDDKELLSGVITNTIGLSLALGSPLTCSVDGFYKNVTSSTTATSFTPDTTRPWIFSQGQFKWNGNPVARITNASITIALNYDPEVGRQIGSRFVEAGEPGLRKYDWTITVKMTDTIATTLRDDFYGQDNTPHLGVASAEPAFYDIIFDFSEGSTSGLRNAQVLLSSCAINDISKPINIGENIVELTINGTAKKGTTDTVNKPFKWWTVP